MKTIHVKIHLFDNQLNRFSIQPDREFDITNRVSAIDQARAEFMNSGIQKIKLKFVDNEGNALDPEEITFV